MAHAHRHTPVIAGAPRAPLLAQVLTTLGIATIAGLWAGGWGWGPGERAEYTGGMAKDRVLPPEEWAEWPDEKLLDLKICQLGVSIEGSVLADRIAELQRELEARGMTTFEPHFRLSAEWF